jgi:alpha-beta hydrolase superfamily lysophospholipase
MSPHYEHITTADGLTLRAALWLPTSAPTAMITLCHGHSEHVGRYAHLAERLTGAGYGLYMGELRGHGESDGQRGHITTIEEYKTDFDTMLRATREHQAGVPHFIGGHSMGGLVAAHYALSLPADAYAGLLLSGAWLATAVEISTAQQLLARVAGAVWPRLSQSTGLDATMLTHDEGIVSAYENDPLVHGKITAGAFNALTAAQQHVLEQAERIRLPLYVLHGSEDAIAAPGAARRLYEKAGSQDKTFTLYEGLYHEVFNETERDDAIDAVIAWFDAHI